MTQGTLQDKKEYLDGLQIYANQLEISIAADQHELAGVLKLIEELKSDLNNTLSQPCPLPLLQDLN